MGSVWLLLAVIIGGAPIDADTQRRGTGRGGTATLAIHVSDSTGAPVPNVLVTVDGAAERSARTEGGRIAFEGLPPGSYRLRFEREGFITLERELAARAGAPTEVKVTLNPAPPPPPPPAPAEPPKPSGDANPAVFDVPDVFEKEFVRRGAGKTTSLACGDAGNATLIQVNEPIPQHAHAESDEFLYVIGGEGSAHVRGREERLKAGVLVFVPRGVSHAVSVRGRNPLVLLSIRAGEGCSGGQ